MSTASAALERSFRLEEATIENLHFAIKAGETSCVAVVRQYIARVRAYNGVASALVTEDGESIPPASGGLRAGTSPPFPTHTVQASTLLPDLAKYSGPPLEYGRMEATASDPGVQQQFGMIVGIADAGQVNALATLNIRGERSVTCRGEFDRHPSLGPLPPDAPPVCEYFRHFPDALERAAELDAQFGSLPDTRSAADVRRRILIRSTPRTSAALRDRDDCRTGRRARPRARARRGSGESIRTPAGRRVEAGRGRGGGRIHRGR